VKANVGGIIRSNDSSLYIFRNINYVDYIFFLERERERESGPAKCYRRYPAHRGGRRRRSECWSVLSTYKNKASRPDPIIKNKITRHHRTIQARTEKKRKINKIEMDQMDGWVCPLYKQDHPHCGVLYTFE
jgi:hypothetical protein